MTIRFLWCSSVLLVLAAGCAKMNSPTGGPKDRMPPKVVKSMPVNGSVNFKGREVSITFDEYVVLDNINEKLMVSPPMKKKPRILLRGKDLRIDFEDQLKDSTTFTFYFQDAIKDLNEGNILENFQFVFATGPVIDSLSVTGNVYNAFNLEAPEKTTVLLYRELADSFVVKHLPEYISRVDKYGFFRINNVKAATYRLYALKDADNSKNYNLPDEEFAFMDDPVSITPEKNYLPPMKDTLKTPKPEAKAPVKAQGKTQPAGKKAEEVVIPTGEFPLFLFQAKKTAHYLVTSKREMKYQLLYILSLPPDTMKFDFMIPDIKEDKYILERSKANDTLRVWLTDSTLYAQPQLTTILTYPFTDTLKNLGYKKDTIIMRFLAPRPTRATKTKRTVFTYESNIKSGSLKPGNSILFTSVTPFRAPDTSRIRLYDITTDKRLTVPYSLGRDPSNICRYIMKADILKEKKYLLIADAGSFGNIYNEYSDSTGTRFAIKDPESYNQLKLNVSNYSGDRIIQLLDNKEQPVSQVIQKKDGVIVFPLLESGFYRLRVIYDLNGDGEWTTGDFTTHRQPEPVSYYPDEIELKPGWVAEQDWNIGVKNFKPSKLKEKKEAK